jgi:hypothetical protein
VNKRLLHAIVAIAACAAFAGIPVKAADAASARSADKPRKEGTMICAYHSGNCNGFPFASMRERRGYLELYDNGNCNGIPKWSMRKSSRCCEFYPNGNCNGIPEKSVSGVDDLRDVIEFMFYLFIRGFRN